MCFAMIPSNNPDGILNAMLLTLDISPSRTSYGVSIVRILENIDLDRVITAPHCAGQSH